MSMMALDPRWLNSIGLFLDIVGVFLVALPLFYTQEKVFRTEGAIWERIRESNYARWGVLLMISGFVFQIVANWLE